MEKLFITNGPCRMFGTQEFPTIEAHLRPSPKKPKIFNQSGDKKMVAETGFFSRLLALRSSKQLEGLQYSREIL